LIFLKKNGKSVKSEASFFNLRLKKLKLAAFVTPIAIVEMSWPIIPNAHYRDKLSG
jgi:hypothetical protein